MCTYQPGDVDNHVSVCAVDDDGHAVESIEAGDVTMRLSVEGHSAACACG